MRLSFNDEESFKEAVESLRFINLPSDPNASQQFGSSSMMPLQEYESNGDNITPSDPITFRRVESSRTSSIQETRRSGDFKFVLIIAQAIPPNYWRFGTGY